MKQGRTLQATIIELQKQNDAKHDYIAPAKALSLEDNGETILMDNGTVVTGFHASDLFHRQLGTVLGIPGKYYDTMRELKPDLLARNVNEWLQSKDSSHMIRTFDYGGHQTARALLSDRYRRIDNVQVATAVIPLFAGQPNMEVISSEVTEQRMYLKILNKRLETEVTPGDIVQAGVVISNSEVGLGAVSVQPLVYRLVCTNGMVVNDLGERRNHVGRAARGIEGDFALYSDETMQAEDKAFMLKLRDVVMAAIEETRFEKVVNRLRESTTAKITGKVQDVVELASKNYALNQTEQEGVLDYLIRGGDLSLYGLSNAVTRYSQDVESYDRATTLEGVGWQMANMTRKEWNALNA